MADYTAKISALETAMASGILTVEQGPGERITYQTLDHMLSALTYFRQKQADENAAAGQGYGSTLAVFGGDC